MLYTLETLRAENTMNAKRITAAHVKKINDYIKTIEQTRTEQPQPFDDVDYIDEYGRHAEHATIDGESMKSVYKTTICETGTPRPVVLEDGSLSAVIGCGGAFNPYDAEKAQYIGTAEKRCEIAAGDIITGFFKIYFRATVSRFRYDERNA